MQIPNKPRKKLAIVVPVYNESETLEEALAGLKAIRPGLEELGVQTHIVVIDDGSEDNSLSVAEGADIDRIISHSTNRGVGATVRTGIKAAHEISADIVVKVDADLQHDPEDILAIVQPILDDRADIVYGYRFNRINYKMPFVRRSGNAVFSWIVRWLTEWPVQDSAPGMIALSAGYMSVFNLPGDYNYGQQILIDAYHKNFRFTHVDIAFHERKTGKSHVTLKYPFKVLPQLVMVLAGIKPMKIFVPIGLFFITVAFGVALIQLLQWALGDSEKPITNVNLVLGTSFLGLQALFFGLLAQLIVDLKQR